MTKVGYVGDEEVYLGLVQDPDADLDEAEAVDCELTPAQERAARSAAARLDRAVAAALNLKTHEGARRRIDAAVERYAADTPWLRELYQAAREREWAEQERQSEAEWAAMQTAEDARLADEDARYGPRLFARTPMPPAKIPARERPYDYTHGHPKSRYWVLHRIGCRHAAKTGAQQLRIGPALERYARGSGLCGRCAPEPLLAQDPSYPARRRERESVPVPITHRQMEGIVREIGRWWSYPYAARIGFSMVDYRIPEQRAALGLAPGETLIGWNDRSGLEGHLRQSHGGGLRPIPDEPRAELAELLTAKDDWAVRELAEHPEYAGFLAVRRLTAAELRETKENTP
jgi:hypothetical protein